MKNEQVTMLEHGYGDQSEFATMIDGDVLLSPERILRTERILLIEDDPQMAASLSRRLRRLGYDVILAPDGRVGLDVAAVEDVDVILLDIWMPRMHGLKVLYELRSLCEHVPVMVMTGDANPALRDEARSLGAVDVFLKPFAAEDVVAAVRRLFQF